MYTALASPARDTSASYVAWGHSLVTSPWGEVVSSTEAEETIVYADIGMLDVVVRSAQSGSKLESESVGVNIFGSSRSLRR